MTPIVPVRGRLLGARDAATYLGITVSKIRKLIARRELVVVRNDQGRLEGIFEQDCDAWIARHRRAMTTERSAGAIAVDERMKALLPTERYFDARRA